MCIRDRRQTALQHVAAYFRAATVRAPLVLLLEDLDVYKRQPWACLWAARRRPKPPPRSAPAGMSSR